MEAFKLILRLCVVSSTVGLSIVPLSEAGVFFDHLGTLLLQKGTWETKFHTQTYPENDTSTVLLIERNLNTAIESINNTDLKLTHLKNTLLRECSYAIQLIRGSVRSRSKRSDGIFGFLKNILFGGDDVDEQLALFRAAEDEKIAHVSENLSRTNKRHDEMTNELHARINGLNDGLNELNRQFSLNRKNALTKFTQETLMLATSLIQEIINKYSTIETNPFGLNDEDRIVEKIKTKISKDNAVLDSTQITGKKLENGEIILLIRNTIILKKTV